MHRARVRRPAAWPVFLVLLGALTQTAPASAAAVDSAPQPRIVGGAPASIREVPYQVSLFSRGGPEGSWDCGGAIIDASQIVTAAHCVEGALAGKDPYHGGLGVTAGMSHLDQVQIDDDPQDATVAKVRVHPQWSPYEVRTAGDLAVLTLEDPLVLDGITAAAVALPPDAPIGNRPALVDAPVQVSGYGLQASGLAPSGQLFKLSTVVENPWLCPGSDNATALCASSPQGAACSGDSGGPVVTKTTPPMLVGIVSNGPIGCPAGVGENYVNLATPENRRFIDGSDTPPIAPRQTADLTFATPGGIVTVGQPVVCEAAFDHNPMMEWAITDSRDGTVIATGEGGASFTYRPLDVDAGRGLSCTVRAINAGGVAVAGPVPASTPVSRPRTPPVIAAPRPGLSAPFRLPETLLTANAPAKVKRGKVLKVVVHLTNLFGAADNGTVCAALGKTKPKCVVPDVKKAQAKTLAFRFRIGKRAKPRSLQTVTVTAVLAGTNPRSGRSEQINRAATVRARVSR